MLLLVEPCIAAVTVPSNPSPAPEIVSVVIHNDPIWNPPITNTNPYTGEVTYNNPGYWIRNGSIEITIKNRAFTSYTDKNGNHISIYYSIFTKTSSSSSWSTLPQHVVYQSDNAYTIINSAYGRYDNAEETRDFRIQAVTGYHIPSYETVYALIREEVPPVYEGVGSRYVEFSVKIPSTDEPGTSKLNIQPSSVIPSTSNPINTPTAISNTTLPLTDTPPTSDPYNPPLQPYLIISFATICIIIIPIAIVAYLNKKQNGFNPPQPITQ